MWILLVLKEFLDDFIHYKIIIFSWYSYLYLFIAISLPSDLKLYTVIDFFISAFLFLTEMLQK
jgi:hypothetical protein